ncbi:VOC family protein [Faunimonas sp. B44]|uniref:VOC family protein n=1 Tax=Faunimonas sp. B44 TaxID=3461493 RepID=UPI0040448A6D
MIVQPYLSFEGRCEEAIAFYRETVGAEVEYMMRFSEAPELPPPGTMPPGMEDKVMHASLRIGDSIVMASDGMCGGKAAFSGISLALTARDADEAERVFAALAEGGQVMMPIGPAFFSPRFGMLADRFGVPWMVVVDTGEGAGQA